MEETGSLAAIFDSYASLSQVCPNKSGEALGFNSCFSAFLVLVVGISVGLVLMSFESILARLKFQPQNDPKTPELEQAVSSRAQVSYISKLQQIIWTLKQENNTLSMKLKLRLDKKDSVFDH